MSFSFTISQNAQDVVARLGNFTPKLLQGMAATMDKENQLTIAHAQLNYLRGPRPQKLGVVTSRLRSSLTAAPARVTASAIISSIGTNVAYAGLHEHGFTGPVQVRAHSRTATRTASVTGSAIGTFDLRTGRIRRPRAQKIQLRGATHEVRAHTRQLRMPARPFLAPSLRDREADYGEAISASILRAWDGAL